METEIPTENACVENVPNVTHITKKKKKKKYSGYADDPEQLEYEEILDNFTPIAIIPSDLASTTGTEESSSGAEDERKFVIPKYVIDYEFYRLNTADLVDFAEFFGDDVGIATLEVYYNAIRSCGTLTEGIGEILLRDPSKKVQKSIEELVAQIPKVSCEIPYSKTESIRVNYHVDILEAVVEQ